MKDQNVFKDKLFHHTLPVSDDLWQKIETQLPAKKKRFPFFWFSLGLGSLMAGGAILWFSLLPPKDPAPKPDPQQQHEPGATAVLYPSAGGTTKSKLEASSPTQTISQPETTTSSIASVEGPANASATSPITLRNSHTTLSKNKTSSVTTSERNRNTEPSIHGTGSASSSVFIESDLSNSNFPSQITSAATASIPGAVVDLIADEDDILDLLKIRPDPSCYKFTGEKSISPLSIDVFGGPGYSPRSFESTGGELAFYREARQRTEHHQYGWSAGARVNYNLHGGYALRVGLEYLQAGDVFDYTDTLATQTTTRIDSFFAADGTFLYSDTSRIIVLGTLIKKIHNRYSNIDVPLIFSYELPMGRSTIMLNAGPVLNLTTSYRGQILDPGLVPRHITPDHPNNLKAYKTSLGLSVYLGAGLLLPLNQNFSALIEPRFVYRIKPVTVENYPLKEHRHFAGLNLGLRYHFHQ